jgi:uncharacterized membrane protein
MSDRSDAMERSIGRVLQAGVLLAIALAAAGGCVHFIGHSGDMISFAKFEGVAPTFASPSASIKAACAGDGLALMQCSVLVLIATPIVRVLASLVIFAARRDALYVGVTLVVLAALAVGLFGGAH